ncbi:MBL fold metallo-hydrolase [Halorarius halobius]|uniref:MBL fold metallo-hydrolase n=1 Tax=Halorarius halobius TaxID=2962671 RepID=UPI0020CC9CF3|nr:MBL fold metallo-hydrolase [Halorarius halobius]
MSGTRLSSVRRIEFAVDWPPGHVAAYLLDLDEPVLVDAGMRSDYDGGDEHPDDTLDAALAETGYELADIEHLVVTHPHVDHVGQAPRIIEAADPTVYAPVGVRERFDRDVDALAERVRDNASAAGIAGDQLDEAVEMAVESLRRDRSLLPPDAVDEWLDSGPVELGPLSAEAVHVPGHQADHLAFLTDLDGERALLAGDMALEPFRAVLLHDGLDDGYVDAVDGFYAALDRLADLEVDRVYPGHGPVHDQFDEVVERDRDRLDAQLDRIEGKLSEGLRTVPGVAMALAGDRGVRYMIPEAMSALAHLERTGRATVTVEDGVRYYDPA